MNLIGLVRLGRDAEVRYTTDGTPVCSFSGAWNYGRKDADGKRPSQWVELTMWGERGEKISEYLLKGKQFFVIANEVHIETYQKRDNSGDGFKLVGKVESLEFTSGGDGEPQRQAPAPAPAYRPPAAAHRPAAASQPPRGRSGTGFDDMDDDIPF